MVHLAHVPFYFILCGVIMYSFTFDIADASICAQVNYPETVALCKAYFTDKAPPKHTVTITQSDIDNERAIMRQEDEKAQTEIRFFPKYALEQSALLRAVSNELVGENVVLIHGSAISVNGKGYLFVAPSGTGKSTHTRLWRELLGADAIMINDDKPFLRMQGKDVWIYGSPWQGKHNIGNPIKAPLCGICAISQSEKNQIQRVSPFGAVPLVLKQCHIPKNAAAVERVLGFVDSLLEKVPVYALQCDISREAAQLSYNTMLQGERAAQA